MGSFLRDIKKLENEFKKLHSKTKAQFLGKSDKGSFEQTSRRAFYLFFFKGAEKAIFLKNSQITGMS